MSRTIEIAGSILVEDILGALSLDEDFDAAVLKKFPADRRIRFDDVEIGIEAAVNALDDADALPEPEDFGDQLDQTDVQDLAAAIRRGDRAEAELLLDRVFAHDTTVTEWVQLGRYSGKARVVAEQRLKAA